LLKIIIIIIVTIINTIKGKKIEEEIKDKGIPFTVRLNR